MNHEHKSIEEVVAEVPREMIASNARWIVALVVCLVSTTASVVASYVLTRTTIEYRLADHDKEFATLSAKVEAANVVIEDMRLNGHGDHERRIAKLEGAGVDRISEIVKQQSVQIAAIADAVAKDHDAIVRMTAIWERRENRENPPK